MNKAPRTQASEDLAQSHRETRLGLHPLSPKLQPAEGPAEELKGRSSPPLPVTEHTRAGLPAACGPQPGRAGPPLACGPEPRLLTSRGSGV